MNLKSDIVLERVSQRFKILGDVNRLRVLNFLQDGEERNVTEVIQETGLKQANVSKILITLAQEGIIGKRKDGNQAFYRIIDASIFELCDIVCSKIDEQMRESSLAWRENNADS